MHRERLINTLALRTGISAGVLARYKDSALIEMKDNIKPLHLNYEQVSKIMNSINKTNGCSYRPLDNSFNPATGYMVALVGFERITNRIWNSYDLQSVLNEWLASIKYTGDSLAYIGLWENDGKLYMDLSQHFVDREKAIVMGKQRKQIAIWDCENKTEIKTS